MSEIFPLVGLLMNPTPEIRSIRYGHNVETWTRMWKRVFTELEGENFGRERVRVRAEFVPSHVGRPGDKWFVWSVTMI